jgi:dipeptidyl aminopeptidase/acylaminoacyl peptidase
MTFRLADFVASVCRVGARAGLAVAVAVTAAWAQTPKVERERLEPHWFGDHTRFWYRNDLKDSAREFVLVDAVKGERKPAFDHVRVAAALAKLTGREVSPTKLPIEALEFPSHRNVIGLRGTLEAWTLELESYALTADASGRSEPETLPFDRELKPSRRTGPETKITFHNTFDFEVELFWLDAAGDRRSYGLLKRGAEKIQPTFAGHNWLVARPGGSTLAVFEATEAPARAVLEEREPTRRAQRRQEARPEAPATAVPSPDGRWEAFVRDHNVWVRELARRTNEFALSFDGNPGHSFHRDASRDRLVGMDYEKADWPETLPEVGWAPDSRKLIALQTRSVPERRVYLVESTPKDQLQPKLQSYPYLKPGDEIPVSQPRLFDVSARREVRLENSLFPNPWELSAFRWAQDSSRFTFVYNQRGHQVLRVLAGDATTGVVRALVDEHSDTFIHYSGKFFCEWLGDGELLWLSERDGWNHLWLYDARSGRVKRQVTRGTWNVRDVVRVDHDKREVWFRAVGLQPDQDPYHVHFARVSLDPPVDQPPVLLTEGDGTHTVHWSPDNRYLVDTYSRVDQPPIHELRRCADGSLVCRLEAADASEVLARRGRFPERFTAKGRDGSTDIWGLIHRPKAFDPGKKYPVLESIYAGPHDHFVPKAFRAAYRTAQEFTDHGFVVVQIDGMGTAWRSKKFHDVAWNNLRDAGFPDRIAWLRAAAAKFPELDLTRVGIYGGSAGGQNAAAALLWQGDFYKAAVADCGCHDNRMDKIWWNEQWLGWPVGPHYAENSNTVNADKLRGALLLVVGELDQNVDPASTLQFAAALTRAGRDYELMVVPGAGHGAAETPWANRRRLEFFVRQLQP